MIFYDWRTKEGLARLASLQWLGIVGMVVDHGTRGLALQGGGMKFLGLFGITLPVMALGVGLLVEVTRNEWAYLWRLLGVAVVSQVAWIYSGLAPDRLNDLFGLGLGLFCIILERRQRWLGLGVSVVVGIQTGLWCHVLMVWCAWVNKDMQEVYVYFLMVLGMALAVLDLRFFAWVVAAFVIIIWAWKGQGLKKLGRLMYWLYPIHLGAIGLVRGLV